MRRGIAVPHLLAASMIGAVVFFLSMYIFVVSFNSDLRRAAIERWGNINIWDFHVLRNEGTGEREKEDLSATTLISLSASIGSLVAFLSTTMLAWRKERREARLNGLELERMRLEIEKLRADLEEHRRPGELSGKGVVGSSRAGLKKENSSRRSGLTNNRRVRAHNTGGPADG